MRSTLLQQSQLDQTHFNCETLAELIRSIETDFQSRGEVICQIIINDLPLHESDEARLAMTHISEIHKVEVKSAKPSQLLIDILQNWESEFPKMIEMADQLSTDLRLKGTEGGQYTAFVQLIDSCQFLIESLVSMDAILETDQFLNRQVWIESEKLMTHAVGQALQAFEAQDFTLLADVLEYDLANALQSWSDLLKSLGLRLKTENDENSNELSNRIFKKNAPTGSAVLDHGGGATNGNHSASE